jgi:hypothetical protein
VGIAITNGYIGRIYIKKKMNEKARQFLEKASTMLRELNHTGDAEKFRIDLNLIYNPSTS